MRIDAPVGAGDFIVTPSTGPTYVNPFENGQSNSGHGIFNTDNSYDSSDQLKNLFGTGYSSTVNNYNYDPNLTTGYQNLLDSMSNYFTGNADWERTQLQNKFNAEQAQLNRDFQERMSNTAYQRMVTDLRSAGLNPYLAYGQSGAVTPVGSTGTATSWKSDKSAFDSILNLIGNIASSTIKTVGSAYTMSMFKR